MIINQVSILVVLTLNGLLKVNACISLLLLTLGIRVSNMILFALPGSTGYAKSHVETTLSYSTTVLFLSSVRTSMNKATQDHTIVCICWAGSSKTFNSSGMELHTCSTLLPTKNISHLKVLRFSYQFSLQFLWETIKVHLLLWQFRLITANTNYLIEWNFRKNPLCSFSHLA